MKKTTHVTSLRTGRGDRKKEMGGFAAPKEWVGWVHQEEMEGEGGTGYLQRPATIWGRHTIVIFSFMQH